MTRWAALSLVPYSRKACVHEALMQGIQLPGDLAQRSEAMWKEAGLLSPVAGEGAAAFACGADGSFCATVQAAE